MSVKVYENVQGPKIVTESLPIIERDGCFFKDLSRSGELFPYEDWRNSNEVRARDLSERLSAEEIAGLMIYTSHQSVPYINMNYGLPKQYYGGREFAGSGAKAFEATDQQKEMVREKNIRHFLMANIQDPMTAARWTNELQREAEQTRWGIPVVFASDPRHGAGSDAEYKTQAAGFSQWPEGMALASCFDEEICKTAARTMASELRAMGVSAFLGPQIDLATEPRWMRAVDTFGADLAWNKRLTRIFCDAMQTTEGSRDGWGEKSVSTMVKHWPGGGTGEGGRDAHYAYGKYAVFPGRQEELHRKPFLEAAFHLEGPTKKAAAVMPYYTVSWLNDEEHNERVGNAFHRYLIRDLLREKYQYDGIVCTDWGVPEPTPDHVDGFAGKCFGAEHLSQAEQCLRCIENGVDQMAGFVRQASVAKAFELGAKKHGREEMERLLRASAYRILLNIFRLGLFENPYVDLAESERILTDQKSRRAGFEAQLKSAVLLKNRQQVLPLKRGLRVYVPNRHISPRVNFFSQPDPAREEIPVQREVLAEYFVPVEHPEEADAALVFMESPESIGYLRSDRESGGNGYLPISLQYRPYTARYARAESIAGGDPLEDFTNRSYLGKTSVCFNERDLDNLLEMRRAMGSKPVIACVRMKHPFVPAELEPYADAILVEGGITREAVLELISGGAEPAGRLCAALPRDMDSLETHCEDAPFDYPAYEDEERHIYAFGYGMSWSGVIG